MADGAGVRFRYDPDPANPGWFLWGPRAAHLFNDLYEPILVREDGEGRATVRVIPGERLISVTGTLHGGATAGFIDIALFAGLRGCRLGQEGMASTIDLQIQYVAPGRAYQPLDARVELVRETKRLVFLRGVIEQEAGLVASFMATVRKAPSTPSDPSGSGKQ